jgi:ribonuclease H2 subunit C
MDDDEEQIEEKLVEELGAFEEFTVWDHEALPVATEDPYVMGVEEWIALAEVVGSSARIKVHY